MKILAVCEHGINRSVAARWMLQHEGHEVIPIGLEHTVTHLTAETLAMLYMWADVVIVLDARLADRMLPEKMVVWDVGPDTLYPHHLNPDLVARLRSFPPL
jgi:galactitol-specific phosphotransferase system IIB component